MALNLSGLCCALAGVARSWRVPGAKERDVLPEAYGNPCRALVAVARSLPSVARPILSRFCHRESWRTEAHVFLFEAGVDAVAGVGVVTLRGAGVQGGAVGWRRLWVQEIDNSVVLFAPNA